MAHRVSVENERPTRADSFLIDTNVLLFVAYLEFYGERARALRNVYSGFLQQCKRVGASLFVCGLSYAEIANAVDRFRWQEYGGETVIDRKQFRSLDDQRRIVLGDLRQVWADVRVLAKVLDVSVDEAAVDRVGAIFGRTRIDGYDGFLIDAAHRAKIPNVITDDQDFATASNLIVFTANRTLLD